MNKVFIKTDNYLIYKNKFLLKCIALLWASKAHDMLFVSFEDHVKIELKGGNYLDNPVGIIKLSTFRKICIQVKICCSLDIVNTEPQSGSFLVYIDKIKYQIRASFHPTMDGENLSFRMVNPEFFKEKFAQLDLKGFNLIGGRTCSGKTTLMYSIIQNFPGRVITLEDPVEYNIPNIVQTDISLMGYEDGIKSALRQNPDLICIGEIRDLKSAQMAVRASLTGHSVLATIHTASAEGVIYRLNELGCLFIKETLNYFILCENFQYKIFKFKEDLMIENKIDVIE